jgi:hypothetical protein
MKKVFMVEIDYDELDENVKDDSNVLSDVGLEIAVENFMEGYRSANSIKGYSEVKVRQLQ